MEPFPSAIPTLSDPADVARFFEERAGDIGILATPEARGPLFDSLTEILGNAKRRVVRISAGDDLQRVLGEWIPPAPEPVVRNPVEWRDTVIAGLRTEQQSAQERVAAAKAASEPVDPFDRDVSSWLAAGLRDLFEDKITSASFLVPDKGIFARLPGVQFAESDFLRPDGIRFLEASRSAQSMLTKLSLASTNQYRTSAARLMNRVLEACSGSRQTSDLSEPQSLATSATSFLRIAQVLTDRGEELLMLVEDDGTLDSLRNVVAPIQVIVAIAEVSALPDRFTLIGYALPTPEVVREVEVVGSAGPTPTLQEVVKLPEPAAVASVEEVGSAEPAPTRQEVVKLPELAAAASVEEVGSAEPAHTLQEVVELPELVASAPVKVLGSADRARAELFIQRGLLLRDELPESDDELRRRLVDLWRSWFTQHLADFDAEFFLTHAEKLPSLTRPISAVATIWEKSDAVLRLPSSNEEFDEAEKAIAEIRRLDREWRNEYDTPIDEGMAFDAAVAAGGAPLDMLTEGVKWWLRRENWDWEKYRIVRIEELGSKPNDEDREQRE